jgi:ELWxxDGT repeat protein
MKHRPLNFLWTLTNPVQEWWKKRRRRNQPRRGRLALEQLEDRAVPTLVTSLVKVINPTGGNFPGPMVNVNGTLFFSTDDGVNGQELWKSDGTAPGTVMVKDINPGPNGSFPSNLTAVGNTLFFTADDGTHGTELWKSDGTAAGTVLVKDIFPGSDSFGTPNSSFPQNLTNFNGTLFFRADDGVSGQELWKSDGTTAGTVLVKDILPGAGGSAPTNLTAVGNILFFSADDAINGIELWKSDGTAPGTVLVKDIFTGLSFFGVPNSSFPSNLTAVGNTLFFSAADGVNGTELWKSDGTTAGTVMVKDINPGPDDSVQFDSNSGDFTAVGNTLFFPADDGVNGTELWKSDGTAAGTALVKDIFPGSDPFGSPNGSFPGLLTNVNGTLFFTADDAVNGSELWKSDGTAAGTALVKDINPGSGSSLVAEGEPIEMVPMRIPSRFKPAGPLPRDLVFLTADDGTHGRELWVSDGTANGTVLVQDIFTGSDSFGAPNSSFPHNLTPVGGTLFFVADDGTNGVQLWATHNVPVITSVSSTTPSGTYGAGENINVTVTFDTPVTLAGGNLTITLSNGATVTVAPFANSFTASGTYTVAPGQMSNPLDTTVFALAPGATIRDADGNDAVLAIPAGGSLRDNKTIVINAHVPVIAQASSTTADGVYGAGANINVTVTFDTPLTLSGGNLRITLNDGATVVIPPFSNSATASGTYVVRPGDQANPLDTDTPLVLDPGATLADSLGNTASLTIPGGRSLRDLKTIIINAHLPVITRVTSTTLDGTYGLGESINVTVIFDTAVTLAAGNLTVALNDGATVVIPPFSNSATASGTYVVRPGDQANPLDTDTPLVLDPGATLADSLGNMASPAIPTGGSLRDARAIIIDTRIHSKIGVARPASDGTMSFLTDNNGDGVFDDGDASFTYGYATDTVLVGDWTGRGFDSVAVVRPTASGVPSISFDTNGDRVFDAGDQVAHFGLNGDTFLVGDWNGDGRAKIGVERPAPDGTLVVTLDENGDGVFDAGDSVLTFGLTNDVVFVGDWDGSGNANQLGSVRAGNDGVAVWTLQTRSGDLVYHFGYNTDTFVVGNWTNDGKTKIGVIRTNPDGSAIWSLDTNGDGVFDAGDQVTTFGRGTDLFLVGGWNPLGLASPLTAAGGRLDTSPPPLSGDALLTGVGRAVAEWAAAGLDPASVVRLQGLDVRVGSLGGATLAQSSGDLITLDATAAGYGWSEGPTREPGKMDLTTALAHEMGHALGLEHSPDPNDVMFETLVPDLAKAPTAADVVALDQPLA